MQVVLPAPLGPRRAKTSPRETSKLDVVERHELAVGLPQARDRDGGHGAPRRPGVGFLPETIARSGDTDITWQPHSPNPRGVENRAGAAGDVTAISTSRRAGRTLLSPCSRRISSSTPEEVLQAEADIGRRLEGQHFDFTAMSAVSNVYRAGTAVRNHMERTVLAEYDLSWVAFTVLWVLWIWGAQETGHVAEEAGVTKGTLTGVIKTLQTQKLISRIPAP